MTSAREILERLWINGVKSREASAHPKYLQEEQNNDVDNALRELNELLPTPEQLHQWYLEATAKLSPASYNNKAQRPFMSLTTEQRFIDEYIASQVKEILK